MSNFREELEKTLGKYKVIGDTTYGLGFKEANELVDQIIELVKGEIVGEMEDNPVVFDKGNNTLGNINTFPGARNNLRHEQLAKLEEGK